jgi:yecA family protein
MNNAEQIDGFFAALICSPKIAKPSQYLAEIWGGEMADEEAFDFPEFTDATLEQHCLHTREGGNFRSFIIPG